MKFFIAEILSKGKKEKVNIYAHSTQEASELIKRKYTGILITVSQQAEPLEIRFKRLRHKLFRTTLSAKPDLLIASMRQLAVMTNAGISIYDSLCEIAKSTREKNLKFLLETLAEDINSGYALSQSMEKFRFELGNLSIAMIRLGEKTGNLDNSLYSLVKMLEEIRINIVKFKKATAYPRNVAIAMTIAFTLLISYVVPNFKKIFEKFNADLPLPTLLLLHLEYFFNNYGLYLLALLLFLFVLLKYFISNYEHIRSLWHTILLKTYLIKDIIVFAMLSRFTLVFSELLRAGIPVTEALDTAVSMVEILPLQTKLSHVKVSIEKGSSLYEALQKTNLFENMIIQMIYAAEQSGTLDSMVDKAARYYTMRFDTIIDGLSEAVEPILLFVLAGMILLLALGIFLPMWNLGNILTSGM